MSNFGGERLSVAKVLYQLDFYLRTLNVPLTIRDLYERAYKAKRKDHYDDTWLSCLADDPTIANSLEEPYTTQTIIETLMKTGHEPIVRVLMKEVKHRNIGFTQAYMIGMPRRPQ